MVALTDEFASGSADATPDGGTVLNYAALLGLLVAVTFALPMLARLAVSLGLHRDAGVVVSLAVALLAALGWFARARAAARKRAGERDA